MNDDWQKVRKIFDSAIRRQPEERREFVRGACGEDESLLAEVESLLASLDGAESFLETPAVAKVADVIAEETATKKLKRGKRFNHYEIVECIGAGGMGEVYLAEDKKLDRRVAVKILNERFSREESNLKRFVQEAKAASALNHPNILVIHEIGEANQAHYIVSEYVKGETLREILRGNSSPKLSEILDIAIQIAAALHAAHEAHLAHRDIKPENVMIRPDGFVKVLDFGLAKLVERKNKSVLNLEDSTAAPNQTAKGVILGTINYMSPEQAKGERVDERTDIFSLGVLIYEMIAGRTPFAGDSMSETFANLINKEPPPLSRFSPNAPDALRRIVSKMLRKRTDERYQTMKDVLTDLRDLRENLKADEKLARVAAIGATEVLEIGGTNDAAAISSDENGGAAHQQSGAEYIVGEIKNHKRAFFVAALAVLLVSIGIGWRLYENRSASTDVAARQINSIAVLPFENGSGDANLDYLSDGLSESLIDKLSQLAQLKVIARSSSFKYRGANIDLPDAANKLGVQAIVTGRIARVGDDLIVRVEMIDAGENRQLWSEQYNRKAVDLLGIQQEIAQTASEKLRLRLSGAQEQQLAKRETESPQAYELVLKGRYIATQPGTDNWKKVVEYMQQAVVADPGYALARAELANWYLALAVNSVADPKEYLPKAEAEARRALELDPNLPEAQFALGRLMKARWQWEDALRELRRGVELDPNSARARRYYMELLNILGRHDEAIAEARRAKELDPLSSGSDFSVAYQYYFARRYDAAISEAKKLVEVAPNADALYVLFGSAYAEKGEFNEAVRAFREAIRLGNKTTSIQISLGAAHARGGEGEEARRILQELEATKEYVSPGELAILYGALGDKEKAFQTLEAAFDARDLQLQNLAVDPAYDSLRGDLRFDELIRRVGLK